MISAIQATLYRVACSLLITIACASPALAIVNIEGKRADGNNTGLAAALNFQISGASGNTDKLTAITGGHLRWQHQDSSTLLLAKYYYGQSNDVRDTNKRFAHLRHIMAMNETSSIEGFMQLEQDEFTRLSLRQLIGAGLRRQLTNDDKGSVFVGIGAFYSTEELTSATGITDSGREILWRGNSYLAVNYALNERVRLESTTYYQPSMDQLSDYRLLEQAVLKVDINERLLLRMTLDIAKDSRPPQTVKQTDINYLCGIEYHFKRVRLD